MSPSQTICWHGIYLPSRGRHVRKFDLGLEITPYQDFMFRVIEYVLVGSTPSVYRCECCDKICTDHHFQLMDHPMCSYVCTRCIGGIDLMFNTYLDCPPTSSQNRWLLTMYDKRTIQIHDFKVPSIVKL